MALFRMEKGKELEAAVSRELRAGVEMTYEAMVKLAESMPGKPFNDVDGERIGTITKAWVDGDCVRYTVALN